MSSSNAERLQTFISSLKPNDEPLVEIIKSDLFTVQEKLEMMAGVNIGLVADINALKKRLNSLEAQLASQSETKH